MKPVEMASIFWIVIGVPLISWVVGLNVQNNIFCSSSVFGSCLSPLEIRLIVFGIILILAAIFILARERRERRRSSLGETPNRPT